MIDLIRKKILKTKKEKIFALEIKLMLENTLMNMIKVLILLHWVMFQNLLQISKNTFIISHLPARGKNCK